MKLLLIAGALALAASLAGCGGGSALGTIEAAATLDISQGDLDTAKAAYDAAFLAPSATYRQLGYCATGTTSTLAKPCASRTFVATLQKDDAAVQAQFATTQNLITTGNNTGLSAAYAEFQTAVTTAEADLAATKGQ